MITLYKNSERNLKSSDFIRSLKTAVNAEVNSLGEFRKWKEICTGHRISVSLTLYAVKLPNDQIAYFFSDSLGRLACTLHPVLSDMFAYIRDHGFKTDHDFYVEDYGMTEEDYAIWNES